MSTTLNIGELLNRVGPSTGVVLYPGEGTVVEIAVPVELKVSEERDTHRVAM